MAFLKLACLRIKALFMRSRMERDIDDEMRLHLDLLTEKYEQSGMRRSQAARAARRQFGNVALMKERARDLRGGGLLVDLFQDLTYALRAFRQSGKSVSSICDRHSQVSRRVAA